MKQKIRYILSIGMLLIQMYAPLIVYGTEVRSVETEGTVSFTGVYETPGTPDPTPPESNGRPPIIEVAKPDGTLPKTNEVVDSWFLWLGILILSFVFLLWKRKNKQLQH